MACWKDFAQFDTSRSFTAWSRGILRHVYANHWRKRSNQQVLLPPDIVNALLEHPAPQAEPSFDQRQDALRHCLQQLNHRARTLIQLRYEQGMGRSAMAQALDRSEAAVKKGLTRVRSTLNECIQRQLGHTP